MSRKIIGGVLLTWLLFSYCGTLSVVASPIVESHQDSPFIVHTAKQGESVSSILKRYQISLKDFLKANSYVKAKWDISVGDILHIPRNVMGNANNQSIDLEVKEFVKQRVAAFGGINSDAPISTVSEHREAYDKKENYANKLYDIHNVLPKETLYSISKKYNVDVNRIIEANPEIISSGLKEYSVIKIPRVGAIISASVPAESSVQIKKEKEVVPFDLFADQYDKNQINISLLLPITSEKDRSDEGFIDLYRGFLLAMDSLKKEGLTSKVDLFGVGRGTYLLDNVLSDRSFLNSNIIIGPVFNEQFNIVAPVAAQKRIPIISPLLQVDYDNPLVFEVMPSNNTYYEKAEAFLKDKNVILYTSVNDDSDFIANIRELTGDYSATVAYNKLSKPEEMEKYLSSDKPNVFIVAAKDNLNIELLISKLAALRAFSYTYKISVFGSSNMGMIPKERRGEFFKADLRYITSAFQNRTDTNSFDFETKYINMFNHIPTPFSYRGYELGMVFIGTMFREGGDLRRALNDELIRGIQSEYLFLQKDSGSKFVNQEWMLVRYTPNYNILTE